ncbi:hypothetical protein JL49_25335, partial [Pseudoalteromonas luteoviolacea]
HGGSADFTIIPEQGRNIASVTGCNGSLNGNVYSVQNVTSACTIGVSFDRNSLVVNALSGDGGSVTPLTQIISYGDQATVTVQPNEGFKIESVTGCEGTLNGST